MPAFPQAQGRGKDATGGRGGVIYVVSNLNNSGTGSFRNACEASGARIIVFKVSGVINLLTRINLSNPNVSILFSTSPSGIIITGAEFRIITNNVIVRYGRFYLGERFNSGNAPDTFQIYPFYENIIIERCNFFFGIDENMSAYKVVNVTIQDCLNAYPLARWTNPITGRNWTDVSGSVVHNYCSVVGGVINVLRTGFAYGWRRMPFFWGQRVGETHVESSEVRNCFMTGWRDRIHSCDGAGDFQLIGNYQRKIDANLLNTDEGRRVIRIMEPKVPNKVYVSGNFLEGHTDITANNVLGITARENAEAAWDAVKATAIQVSPIDMGYTGDTLTADEARIYIGQYSGCCLFPDHIQDRLRRDIIFGRESGSFQGSVSNEIGWVDSIEDCGGMPIIIPNTASNNEPDGIDPIFKLANGLTLGVNYQGVASGTGYDWVEVWNNSIVADLYGETPPPLPPFPPSEQSKFFARNTV